MKKRSFKLLCLALSFTVMAGALASCGGKGNSEIPAKLKNKEEVVIGISSHGDIDSGYDPCNGWGDFGVPLIQNKLMTLDKENNIVNDMATGYEMSSDGLSWTFKLRNDAKFTDGQPVTAKDVAFTYMKAKEIGTNLDLSAMEKAEAVDDSTVKFTFTEPNSAFLYDTAIQGIVPEHAYGDTNKYSKNPIGAGPYKFVSHEQGQQLILERNEDYYGAKPKFKRLVLVPVASESALATIKSGEVDVISISEAAAQQKIDGYKTEGFKSMDFRGISVPMAAPGEKNKDGQEVGNAVSSDIAIRKAMAYAVNRKSIIDDVLYGKGTPARDHFDSLPWGIKDEVEKEFKDGDVEKAKKLLDEAGWKVKDGVREKDGLKAELTLMYAAGDETRQSIAEAFVEQMKALDIKIKLKGTDWTEIEKHMGKDMVVLGGGKYTPESIASLHDSKRIDQPWSNIVRENDSAVDGHIHDALISVTEEEAITNWRKALWDGNTGGSILGNAPYIVVCTLEHQYFVREGLDLGNQKLHSHDRDTSILANIEEWDFK